MTQLVEPRGERLEPRDMRVQVRDDLALRILRWEPAAGVEGAREAGEPESDAVPFLLVHGLASNARLWDGVGRRLAEAGHEAVAVDERGHGLSDKPDGGYDFETIAGDLERLIAATGLDRPIVAGQSWGADVVLDLAVRRPDLVRGVVLVDGGLSDMRDQFPSWDACWERLAPPQLVGTPLTLIQGYFRQAHADWPAEGIAGSLANFEIRADGTVAPWLTRERHKAILRAMWELRPSELWPRLAVPAVVILADTGDPGWRRSKEAGADAAAAALAARGVPHEFVWFAADHDVHAQRPAEVASLILEQLRDGVFSADTTDETIPAEPSNHTS